MGLLKKEKKSKKRWLIPFAAVGTAAAAFGVKKKRSSSKAKAESSDG